MAAPVLGDLSCECSDCVPGQTRATKTLADLREDAGLTQRELARRIGVSQSTVTRAEREGMQLAHRPQFTADKAVSQVALSASQVRRFEEMCLSAVESLDTSDPAAVKRAVTASLKIAGDVTFPEGTRKVARAAAEAMVRAVEAQSAQKTTDRALAGIRGMSYAAAKGKQQIAAAEKAKPQGELMDEYDGVGRRRGLAQPSRRG